MTLRTAVDVEFLVNKHLRETTEVAALVGTRVGWALPPNPVYPLVTVKRIGGTWRDREHLDQPILQVEAWGNDREDSFAVMQVVRAALGQDVIAHAHTVGVVTGSKEIIGPQWHPDPVKGQSRWFMQIRLYTHPLRRVQEEEDP